MSKSIDNAPYKIYSNWQTPTSNAQEVRSGTGRKELLRDFEQLIQLNPTHLDVRLDYRN